MQVLNESISYKYSEMVAITKISTKMASRYSWPCFFHTDYIDFSHTHLSQIYQNTCWQNASSSLNHRWSAILWSLLKSIQIRSAVTNTDLNNDGFQVQLFLFLNLTLSADTIKIQHLRLSFGVVFVITLDDHPPYLSLLYCNLRVGCPY